GSVDVREAKMVSLRNVGDHSDVAAVESQPRAENAASRRLQDCDLDLGVLEHGAGTLGPTAIAGLDAAAADVNAFRARHAHATLRPADDVGQEACGGGLAVDPGDGGDWDAACCSRRNDLRDDRFGD